MRRKHSPALSDAYCIAEQLVAEGYTRKWHAVDDWAFDSLSLMDREVYDPHAGKKRRRSGHWAEFRPGSPKDHRRFGYWFGWQGLLVSDMKYAELVEERAWNLLLHKQDLAFLDGAPDIDKGGLRRVEIHAYTWLFDPRSGLVDNPAFILLSQRSFSAASAVKRVHRYIRNYTAGIDAGKDSRMQVVAAWRISWSTAAIGSDYV